jgi:hypothetical protein
MIFNGDWSFGDLWDVSLRFLVLGRFLMFLMSYFLRVIKFVNKIIPCGIFVAFDSKLNLGNRERSQLPDWHLRIDQPK